MEYLPLEERLKSLQRLFSLERRNLGKWRTRLRIKKSWRGWDNQMGTGFQQNQEQKKDQIASWSNRQNMGLSAVHGTGVRQQNVRAKDTQNRHKVELAELFSLIEQLWVHGNKLQKGDEVFHPLIPSFCAGQGILCLKNRILIYRLISYILIQVLGNSITQRLFIKLLTSTFCSGLMSWFPFYPFEYGLFLKPDFIWALEWPNYNNGRVVNTWVTRVFNYSPWL